MLDLLSDILTRLSLKGTLYFRTEFTPPWGVLVPAYENVSRFHFAHRGECMLRVIETGETVMLTQGDLVIVPHGAAHALYCRDSVPEQALPLERVFELSGYKGEGVLVHGGQADPRSTQLICGHFSLAEGSKHPIFDRMPACIHIRNYGAEAGAWMEATLRVIGGEAGGARLGGDLIALKMSEAIFAQAIRTWLEQQAASDDDLSGFIDPRLSRALMAFHRNPAEGWSIERMAGIAGMSRTSFAQQFARKMGTTPIRYITAWRLQIARQGLSDRKMSVADAAALAGYASESAFSRVFRREVGVPPAKYRWLERDGTS